MKLDENYRLENDSNQWTLIYEKEGEINPKTKKPTLSTNKWYFSNMEQALKRYADESMKSCETIGLVIDLLNDLHGKIDKLYLRRVM